MTPCKDETFWSEREAETFITRVRIPYQRLQFESDHARDDPNHAFIMINAAVYGEVPWVRLNNYPPTQTYEAPTMFLNSNNMKSLIISSAASLFHCREITPATYMSQDKGINRCGAEHCHPFWVYNTLEGNLW
jgi:hypothetical protein